MFDIKKVVPSLELCLKLKELGYPQDEGGFYWMREGVEDGCVWKLGFFYVGLSVSIDNLVKAPMRAEIEEYILGEIFVGEDRYILHMWKSNEGKLNFQYRAICSAVVMPTKPISGYGTEAYANLLYWLVNCGYVTFDKSGEFSKEDKNSVYRLPIWEIIRVIVRQVFENKIGEVEAVSKILKSVAQVTGKEMREIRNYDGDYEEIKKKVDWYSIKVSEEPFLKEDKED